MTRKEWQVMYKFDDEDMDKIAMIKAMFGGDIISNTEIPRVDGIPIPYSMRRTHQDVLYSKNHRQI